MYVIGGVITVQRDVQRIELHPGDFMVLRRGIEWAWGTPC